MSTQYPHRLPQSERLARLRLIRSENVGPVTFIKLLERFGSARSALEALPELARQGGKRSRIKVCPRATAVAEIEAAQAGGARPIVYGDPDYPATLAAIDDPPAVFYLRGDAALLTRPAVAVVGARNASLNGLKLAESFARDLGAGGYVVVSGLARGLDGAAHRGALATGTVAVLAGGIDVVYPRENAALFDALIAQGALISEMPPGTQPQARHFPRRNRIVSGLALGVLVVEATPRSGSLITARYALEQGREVFAIPGSPADPRAKGANSLIKQGALLCDSADDILDALADLTRRPVTEPGPIDYRAPHAAPARADIDAAHARLRELLSPSPCDIDEIIRIAGIGPAAIQVALLELELAGRLERHPGGKVSSLPSGQ